ncbi:MAG: hypothetical protein JWO68_897 [Actinomycetia bacterium]|nr:hypothetical protein [Actinomycetes bacterium]
MRTRWTRGAALLALAAIMAAGCGSSSRKGSDNATGSSTTAAPAKATTFGDIDSPCGAGDAKGATDKGVTDTEITIGYGDDAGYQASPGLNHEMSDAMKAMIQWCNDQGGINGRQVKGNYYDGKITEVNNVITQACSDAVFMLVGEGFALDAAQEQIRLGCKLPAMPTYAVSPEFANGPLMYAAVPNPVDYQPVTEAAYYASKFPDKAKKMGTMFANFPATQDTKDKQNSTWPKVGVTHLSCQLEYNIVGEADWKPFVKKLQDCGAEAVSFVGSPYPNFENFLEAADQLQYHPDYLLQANFYDAQLGKWNAKGLADDIYVRLQDIPFEYASTNKATQDYLDIMAKQGGDTSDLGIHATSAFLLWATAVKSCGSTVTRDCVLKYASTQHDWSGGGLSGKADVGKNLPSDCEVVVSLTGTKWEQVYPDKGGELGCDPKNVQKASGNVVDKVQMGPDRIVHKFEAP